MGTYRSQVLLADDAWIRRLVDRVPNARFGIEWCSGTGALTGYLAGAWDRLLALEIEFRFCRELRRQLSGDVMVIRADVTDYPLPVRSARYPLVGNLPYHLTGPLLMRILRHAPRLSGFYGLVQAEVGERLAADPGSSEYGGLSLLASVYAGVDLPFTVPAEAFDPSPEVDSVWVEFDFREPRIKRPFERIRRFVRRCFRYPRKTLLNNLADDADQKARWGTTFEQWGWSSTRRPGTLTPEDLGRLMSEWETSESSWPRTNSKGA